MNVKRISSTNDFIENVLFSMETDELLDGKLSIDQALLKADSLTLSYICQAAEKSENGKIYLYYDDDNQGLDGKFITCGRNVAFSV